MLQLECLQLSHIWPPFRNIIGNHEELPKSTHLHWIQVSARQNNSAWRILSIPPHYFY